MNLFDITFPGQYAFPHPISFFVLKVTNRCNFGCDYCYYRKKADRSYTDRPPDMSRDIIRKFGRSLGEYVQEVGITRVGVDFHGGEPLLRGIEFFADAIQTIQSFLPPRYDIQFSLQTNASLLTPKLVAKAAGLPLRISVSLDGDQTAQDRHRRFADGNSSFATVTTHIRQCLEERKGRKIFGSVLSVIDLDNDPLDVFSFLESCCHDRLDFLFPDGTHDSPPPGITPSNFRNHHGYADWLIRIFDHWFDRSIHRPQIRTLEDILSMFLGGPSHTEGFGKHWLSLFTIETDGEIRGSDILAIAYEHAARFGNGHYLKKHCFQDLLDSPEFQQHLRLYSPLSLCPECHGCHWRDICGGGVVPHRFSTRNEFHNPSIYCGNIHALLTHIRKRLGSQIPRVHPIGKEYPACIQKTPAANDGGEINRFSTQWDVPIPATQGFTPVDTRYYSRVEPGVRSLVFLLVHRMNWVVYHSCQGHLLPSGKILSRGVTILCRNSSEYSDTLSILRQVAETFFFRQIVVYATDFTTPQRKQGLIHLVFLPDVRNPEIYFHMVEEIYLSFLAQMQRTIPPHRSRWKFMPHSSAGFSPEMVHAVFSDYHPRAVCFRNDQVVVRSMEPRFRNEALSVKHFVRNGNIAIIQNHAWALPFWIRAIQDITVSSPFPTCRILHVDPYGDFESPRLIRNESSGCWMDFFTDNPISLHDIDSIDHAVYSTAIDPHSFMVPFLYFYRAMTIHVDHVDPLSRYTTGDALPIGCHIELSLASILDRNGITMALRYGSEKPAPIRLRRSPMDSKRIPDIRENLLILDIDLSYLFEKNPNPPLSTQKPDHAAQRSRQQDLIQYLHQLISAVSCIPIIVTIATGKMAFPPSAIEYSFLQEIQELLFSSGLTAGKYIP